MDLGNVHGVNLAGLAHGLQTENEELKQVPGLSMSVAVVPLNNMRKPGGKAEET